MPLKIPKKGNVKVIKFKAIDNVGTEVLKNVKNKKKELTSPVLRVVTTNNEFMVRTTEISKIVYLYWIFGEELFKG
jgi:hypothetical protein